jgi:hypothetical protein
MPYKETITDLTRIAQFRFYILYPFLPGGRQEGVLAGEEGIL